MKHGSRFGILGGTFDPPHLGHLVLAQEAYAQLNLDRVWFIPTGQSPHKPDRPISPEGDRAEMVRRAIDGDEHFAISTIEFELERPSYTVRTLQALRKDWGEHAWICLILGWDMLAYLPHWYDPAGVVERVDAIAAARRPGFGEEDHAPPALADVSGALEKLVILDTPELDISSTRIRARVASGLPIRYLVPEPVHKYIEDRKLYIAI